MTTVREIAIDVIANMKTNPNNFTADTLVANWEKRIEWLGLKVGGKAWNRELMKTARNGWVATTQKTSHVIPPSQETLDWGGFLGGEVIVTAEISAKADAAFDVRFPS